MYYNEIFSREQNRRINKLIKLIHIADERNETINKRTLKSANIGSPATLQRALSYIQDEGIIEYDEHKHTYKMYEGWQGNIHIKNETVSYHAIGILKSLLNQYQNTSFYEDIIERVEELSEMPINDFSRIAVPPKLEYSEEDQKKFKTIFDLMIKNYKIQFYYKGRWHGDERKNRIVHPYQLLLENGTCYLYGYDEEKSADRIFVLRRMEEIRTKAGEKFELPVDYEFSERYGFSKFGAYTFKDPVKYKIEFYGNTQIWIKENKWADDQKIEEAANKTILTFTSSQDDKILEWVLSCGPDAKPLEPEAFAVRWREKIQQMSKLAEI